MQRQTVADSLTACARKCARDLCRLLRKRCGRLECARVGRIFRKGMSKGVRVCYGRCPMPPSRVMVSPLMNLKSGPHS